VDSLESLLVLLLAAALLVRLADIVHVPSPIVLVLGGLAIALAPGLPEVELPAEVIFLVFLPPLIGSAGWYSSPQELQAVLRPLALLSLGLVLLSAAAIAVVAHALVPGMGWASAAVLGAVLAPTDAVAATATFARLGAPERVRLLAEGESLINDATALVLFRIAVGAAAGMGFTFAEALGDFAISAAGGVLVGLAVGWLVMAVIRHQTDTSLVILLTVLMSYAAYIAAERVHASGILAAAVAGLYGGWVSPTAMDADQRLTGIAFWRVLVFSLEVALFVLLGLQLPVIVEAYNETAATIADLVLPAAAVAATLIGVRLAFIFAMGRDAGSSAGERLVLGWAGMRGAVSLAAALSVEADVPSRPEIVLITFALILVTLVGQGLTLPPLIRALGLDRPRAWSSEEAVARMEAAQAALDRLDELEDEGVNPDQLKRMRDLYRSRFRTCVAVLDGSGAPDDGRVERLRDYAAFRRDLIGVERESLLGLRSEGRLRQDTLRTIQRDLDLEEARLRG
jgi:monovalent cation/hydrogen antiporter